MALDLPFRQIHLDFHTSPQIPAVGSKFDADEFGDTMAAAHVNSVTVFAKCHHGHLYFDTKHPARHPTLAKGMDLLGEQIEALHSRGIRAPIYISVQCDEYAADTHPQWLVLKPDGAPVNGPMSAGWHIVDMSSPYKDYLAEQVDLVMRRFKPVDGVFMDMCWDQPSNSKWAIDGMRRAGLDPSVEADRGKYAHRVSIEYMGRIKRQIERANGGRPVPVAFNSRPLWNMHEEKKFFRHIEVEALPTGGWGYAYFPLNVRFVRTFGLPYMGMTARFHKSWADFGGLKPHAALEYECAQMLAHGARCSVGDQLHPRGTLDKAAYQLIGKVYKHVEEREPWCKSAAAVTEIAVVRSVTNEYMIKPGDSHEGAVRALQQLRQQFDIIAAPSSNPDFKGFSGYKLVIVPDSVLVDAKLVAALKKHLRGGGSVLIEAPAINTDAAKPLLADLGVATHGLSPFTTTYLRFGSEISAGVAPTDHVMYEQGVRITPSRGGKALARVVEPYFERTWEHFSSHFQTPPDKVSRFAAAVQKGRAITLAHPVFRAIAAHANVPMRQLVGACIDRLLPDPLTRVGGPSHIEVTLNRQGARHVVHLLSYCAHRRAPNLDLVEEPAEVTNLSVSVRLPHRPNRVRLVPREEKIGFDYRNGRVEMLLTRINGHEMIEIE